MPPSIDLYGAPQYGPLGPPEGWAIHTPENLNPSLAQAIATARWQADPARNRSGGSYHGLLGHDGPEAWYECQSPDHWVLVRSVAWNLAAGGISTRRDSIWAPDRYPRLRQVLSSGAYADPNRFLHQLAISGRAAQYVEHGYPRGLILALVRWIFTLERAYRYDAFLTLHRWWQNNRTDPGPEKLVPMLLTEYLQQRNTPVARYTDVPPDHTFYEDIEWLAANGITNVTGRYQPDAPTTRGMMAAFLHRFSRYLEAQRAPLRTSAPGEPVGPSDPEEVQPTEDELRNLEPDADQLRRLRQEPEV